MTRWLVRFLGLMLVASAAFAQQAIPTPAEYLGYRLGERFTTYDRILDYFGELTKRSPRITLQSFGLCLGLAFVVCGVLCARYLKEIGKPVDWAYEMGFAALAGAAFLSGALVIDDPADASLAALRISGVVLLALDGGNVELSGIHLALATFGFGLLMERMA